MKRIILSLVALLTVMTVSAQKYYGRVSDPDGYTNIRRGPGTNYGIVRRYYSGDYLYYTPQSNGWSKVYSGVRSNTYMGYMSTSRIVKVGTNNSGNNTSDNLRYGRIVDPRDNYVNVRRGPGTNYAISTQLYVGTNVYYAKTSSNWYKVYNSKKQYLGYIYKDRVR